MTSKLLYEEKELNSEKMKRKQPYEYVNVQYSQQDDYLEKGWEIDKTLAKTIKLKKEKKISERTENEAWVIFYNMGFTFLNQNEHVSFRCDLEDESEIFSYNVLAGDDDTILLISCRASDKKNMQLDLEREKELFKRYKDKIIGKVRSEFDNRKVAFILVTKNLYISSENKEELLDLGMNHFDEDKMEYYRALGNHLGSAAKYQLLGTIFDGIKIQGINNVIPAIKGEMGGHIYYSFSIEPEVLLKLGYILHRSDSHKDMMPTYQRIIKKGRLNEINDFINQGGYFPNSIIVSIDEGKKGMKFEVASQNSSTSKSKIGLLHLPQKYKSIYIIDGQHRLYGYTKTDYKNNCTIPVVAFVNLDKNEQIKLFMEINENQKSVSKNLRNTLEEDMKYNSDIAEDRVKALSLKIARNFGDNINSPLFDRVIIGENVESQTKNITLEAISKGINSSDFFSKYKKNQIQKSGIFDVGENDACFERVYPILCQSMTYFSKGVGDEWEKGGKTDKTAFVVNNAITGLIKVLSDICIHLVNLQEISPKEDSVEKIYLKIIDYLEPIVEYWNKLDEKEKIELRTAYGGGGITKYWRTFEKVINNKFEKFLPDGMEKYWDGQNKENTVKAKEIVGDIELFLKEDIAKKLENHYGESWFSKESIPKKVYVESKNLAAEKNYDKPGEDSVNAWDCLHLINYREIIIFSKNWSEIFQNDYALPNQGKGGKKDEKTKWLVKLNEIRNILSHSHVISSENYIFLNEIKEWLIP